MTQLKFHNTPEVANAYSIRVPSPEGTLFVHCTENSKGELKHVVINIGKSGLAAAAVADALSRLINITLKYEDVNTVLENLSGITTGKSIRHSSGTQIHSIPQAIYVALTTYKDAKIATKQHPAHSGFLAFR